MTRELSSNWKKLQAQIKSVSPSVDKKRKADSDVKQVDSSLPKKRLKVERDKASKNLSSSHGRQSSRTASRRSMGNVQSCVEKEVTKTTVSPSLALWAEDHGISSEDLAEAYGLGIRDKSMITAGEVRPNEGLAPDIEVGKYVAIDCEMVGIGEGGYESALARVSIVDFHGRQIYDSFVRPKERVTDWRTHVSGVSAKHMATAREFDEVQTQVASLLKGRILVGHDIRHDLHVLLLNHPPNLIRDTAKFSGFKKYGHGPKPALRVLAKEILDVEIHNGQHSSIEDARVAMLLFRRFKQAFDVEHANRFPDSKPGPNKSQGAKKAKKKR
jgi:RNA exonuclease 4